MSVAIEARNVCKSYGVLPILKGIDFDLADGATLAMIGPNGAGKTTLFKVLTGETPATEGSIRFYGEEIVGESAFRRVARGIGRTFQVARVFLEMTARENVIVAIERRRRMTGQPLGRWYDFRPSAEIVEEAGQWLASVALDRVAGTEARFISHGDKKRLELAVALALKPKVLMLDEPTAGMSPSDRHETVKLLARLRVEQGITMMMTEHDMDVVFGLADTIMVLNYGKIIARGLPEAVRNDPTVREVYLGREVANA
jgi:branched-chain amino acid transport system ATP-binding protein